VSGWTWEIVEDPEPDPVVEALLDYMDRLGRIADTCSLYIGPADAPADQVPS
jgi:hypothetical protein